MPDVRFAPHGGQGCPTSTVFEPVDTVVVDLEPFQSVVPTALIADEKLLRGERERTPGRRVSETLTAKINGCSHYFTVSRYDDGRPCEVFIVSGKEGSSMRGLYDALGIVLSHYLQIGGDLDDIADKLRHVQFEPAGLVTGAPAGIERATSPVDALAQYLQTFE